jgi:hypothetical protein
MLVAIGDSPYDSGARTREEDNGMWRVDADTIEQALERMFGSMLYPGAATGRYNDYYIPGVSILYPSEEVIQVWAHDAEAIALLQKAIDAVGDKNHHRNYIPHDGNGHHMGVVREIHVSELTKYITPVRKLLAPIAGDGRTLSPLGASLVTLSDMRQDLQRSMMMTQYEVDLKRRDMEKLEEQMEERQKQLDTGMRLLNMYMHGSEQAVRLNEGIPAAPGERWRVYQTRQFLNKEIGVLANFDDFDFQNLEALDAWLMKTGRIWKLLPFPKTILATRIRDTSKDYHDVFHNIYWNELNFQNILWLRNGENVTRVNVEHDFDNAVFPDPKSEQKIMAAIEERVWKSFFSRTHRGWRGQEIAEKQEPLGLKKNAEKEAEPYVVAQIVQNRFKTLEAWKSSDEFHAIEPQMRQQVFDHIREKNKEQMSFLMLIQGMVDRSKLLDVPPGTDLFQSELCSRYFELIYDYNHGLPDYTYAKQMKPYLTGAKKGDWIIVPYIYTPKGNKYGQHPTLYKVHDVKEDGGIVVRYHPMSRRRLPVEGGSYWDKERRPVKNAKPATLHNIPYLRVDLQLKLAEAILDDREWKMKNEWVTPLLAHWRYIQKKYLAAPMNCTAIEIERPK